MAVPVAAFIQLPLDTANGGKKRRTQTRTVGTDSVHEDFVIPTSARSILGNYICNIGIQVIPIAAQNGTATGFVWFYNPIAGTKKIAIERIKSSIQFNALGVDLLAGSLTLAKFSFTGTGSGAVRTLVPLNSKMPAATANARTAVTGLTVSIIGVIGQWLLPVMGLATGGAGSFSAQQVDWVADDEEEEIILNPGEGIVLYSSDGVTTANRNLVATIHHSEFE